MSDYSRIDNVTRPRPSLKGTLSVMVKRSRAGLLALLFFAGAVAVTWMILPDLTEMTGLMMPSKWPPVTRSIVYLNIAVWTGTLVTSICRVAVWLRAALGYTSGEEWTQEHQSVISVHHFSVWILAILTTLVAFVTQWLSG